MLGPLLAEKFKLAAHRESKDFPVYGLVIAKGGLKVKATEGGRAGTSSHGTPAGGELKATNTTMAGLAGWLSRVVDRPVVDQSGDTGAYDFTLKYSREDSNAEPSSTVLYPILTLAIQEQIGVRLEKRTAPVEILVIDHVEKVPVEN
jgi:uncharacterized protein (TIGR03435 family)